jgi:phage tail-like protein
MPGNGASLAETSTYLRYLPTIYWEDTFLGRFLRVFEDVLTPVQGMVNGLPQQFDPALASSDMLALLATWVGVDPEPGIDETAWRRLVKDSLLLHGLRGTKRGLKQALEIVTGRRPFITEYSPGLVLGEDASLGLNSSLESGAPLQFHVAFDCRASDVDPALVHAIIQYYKPVHVTYSLAFLPEAPAAG